MNVLLTKRWRSPHFVNVSVIAAGIGLLCAACGTLSESHLDQTLKARGKFLCPAKPLKSSLGTNEASTQARCYRDSVVISESRADWNRVFYPEKDCTGDPMGSADWRAKFIQEDPSKIAAMKPSNDSGEFSTQYAVVQSRTLTRNSPDWYANGVSGCDLRKLSVNVAAPVSYESPCASLLPKNEPTAQRSLIFIASAKEGARSLRGFWETEATVCIR